MKNHIYTIQLEQLQKINDLAKMQNENFCVIIGKNGTWLDFAYWNNKYQNIAILTLPVEKLDKTSI